MEGLILFSHGSLLCGAGTALEAHAARLRTQGAFDVVEIGYMNYSQPYFAEAVARCAAAGAVRIVVAPYFLVPGKFVSVDLPRHIAEAQAARPGLAFAVADPIGYDASLADALISLAADAKPADFWDEERRR